MKFSFGLEYASNGSLRGTVFKTMNHGYRPVTVIHDIAEGSYIDLWDWLAENYPQLNTVRMPDGTFEEADCLTLMEAAVTTLPHGLPN
jgi:hypothetical protein